MSPTTRAWGAGAGWATDAALDKALGPYRCTCCGDVLDRGRCRRCAEDDVCRLLGCGPEPLSEEAKMGRVTRPGRT